MEDFKKLFESFSSLKVGVIGDVMLDTYMWGKVERISPEAPVPVVSLYQKEYRIGGAGNVALNCQSLGAQVSILSVIGTDTEGVILKELFDTSNIDSTYLLTSADRITTNKTRIISRNQQMLRLDAEVITDLHSDEELIILKKIKEYISSAALDVLIFEDYNKGVLTEKIIQETILMCKQAGVITAVDPKKKNFFAFRGTDIFKPNLKEVKEGLNLLVEQIDQPSMQKIHRQLQQQLNHTVSIITLSEKGVFYQDNTDAKIIPSHIRNVADVSGAGDTVIAVASLVYARTKNARLMAEVANIAGGLVCEEVGTVAISKEKLLDECELLLA